ncbi:MAG: hypothetical protein M3Y48_15090 [Actinomycetota bacterium]|nr:hypothetical protein [Actinomycetota bacterium]
MSAFLRSSQQFAHYEVKDFTVGRCPATVSVCGCGTRGQWAVLQASPLIGGDDDQIAVAIEPATGDQLISLLLVAYGLTSRERDIGREVIARHSTADIAGRLLISAHTGQHCDERFRTRFPTSSLSKELAGSMLSQGMGSG